MTTGVVGIKAELLLFNAILHLPPLAVEVLIECARVFRQIGHQETQVGSLGHPFRLEEYHVDAITGGTDAVVDVTVKLNRDGRVITSKGARSDIIEASVEAVVSGMNRLLRNENENRSTDSD